MTVADSHNLPWAVMGEFNELIAQKEKYGGNPICIHHTQAYSKCIDYFHLMDLGFSGPKFTWTNLRGVTDLIQERLDKGWANSEWKTNFPEASIQHLSRF